MVGADHRTVCRPADDKAPQYTPLRDHLVRWVQEEVSRSALHD